MMNDDAAARAPLVHSSDCALHNAPAVEAGPCDCGALRRAIFNAICLHVQGNELGHWEYDYKSADDRIGERVFVTSNTEIDLLEHVCNEAADAVMALVSADGPTKPDDDGDYTDYEIGSGEPVTTRAQRRAAEKRK